MKVRAHSGDRDETGRLLADRLLCHAGMQRLLVIGLAHGGVPLATEVGKVLHRSPRVLSVCKLGVPGHPELTLGAMASGGIRVLNNALVYHLGLTPEEIDALAQVRESELRRRERTFGRAPEPGMIRHHTVILVDDAVATGCTMRAAIQAVRRECPERIIVAAPVIAGSCMDELRAQTDSVVVLDASSDAGTLAGRAGNPGATIGAEVIRRWGGARGSWIDHAGCLPRRSCRGAAPVDDPDR